MGSLCIWCWDLRSRTQCGTIWQHSMEDPPEAAQVLWMHRESCECMQIFQTLHANNSKAWPPCAGSGRACVSHGCVDIHGRGHGHLAVMLVLFFLMDHDRCAILRSTNQSPSFVQMRLGKWSVLQWWAIPICWGGKCFYGISNTGWEAL